MLNSFIFNNKLSKLLVIVTIFFSTKLYAYSACNIELDAGIRLTVKNIEFFTSATDSDDMKKILYTIENDQRLTVQKKEVNLTHYQQKLVTQYATNIRALVPQVKTVANESVNISLEGVNLVFNDLLGEDNAVGTELTQELSVLRDEAVARFTPEHGITIGENGVDNIKDISEQLLGEKFKQRIEASVEKAVINVTGSLLIAMTQEMLMTGKQGHTLEARMENFSENVANEVKIRIAQIERKADVLCLPIVNVDQLEEQMKTSISPLANINVISARLNKSK